jgi:hypothetical protein
VEIGGKCSYRYYQLHQNYPKGNWLSGNDEEMGGNWGNTQESPKVVFSNFMLCLFGNG